MLESKLRLSGKSFMNVLNSKEPNIEPCGISLRTEVHFEKLTFILTHCLLFLSKASIKSISKGSKLYLFNLLINLLCGTLSKAF